MRKEDLIPRFLDFIPDENGLKQDIIDRIAFNADEDNSYDYYASEDSDFDLDELFDAMQEFCGPYFYFGSHPSDGADYGFWLCENTAQEVKDSGGYVVSDLSECDEIAEDDTVEVLHVNDHGNCTLYAYNPQDDEFEEIWAVV